MSEESNEIGDVLAKQMTSINPETSNNESDRDDEINSSKFDSMVAQEKVIA